MGFNAGELLDFFIGCGTFNIISDNVKTGK